MNLSPFRLAAASAALLAFVATASPVNAEVPARGKSAFPFPIPGGNSGISLPIPGGGSFPLPIPSGGNSGQYPSGGTIGIPIPGGGSFPLPIPTGGRTGQYPSGNNGTIGIPIPGGGTFPLPIPTGGRTGNTGTIGIPIPGGGSFPLPIPTGGRTGQYPSGNTGTIGIPIPGGGSFPLPIPTGGNGGSFPLPIPGGSGGTSFPIPIPGGDGGASTFPIPIPGGNGGGTTFPIPSNDGGTYLPGGQPSGYKALKAGGKVARIGQLPLQVYNTDSSKDRLLAGAMQQWNQAGQQLGLGNMFEQVTSPGFADFSIDWSGRGLPAGVLGSAQMSTTTGKIIPTKLTMRSNLNRPQDHVQEILTHELGHMVGLDHSDTAQDLMYHTERTSNYSGSGLTQRDLAMVKWLYSQQNYVPIGR